MLTCTFRRISWGNRHAKKKKNKNTSLQNVSSLRALMRGGILKSLGAGPCPGRRDGARKKGGKKKKEEAREENFIIASTKRELLHTSSV